MAMPRRRKLGSNWWPANGRFQPEGGKRKRIEADSHVERVRIKSGLSRAEFAAALGMSKRTLARIIHDSSSRNHAVAERDGRAVPREPEAYLKQYVEGASGEPGRLAMRKPWRGLS
jgi:DNA-binding XRE family transcriptional regulator